MTNGSEQPEYHVDNQTKLSTVSLGNFETTEFIQGEVRCLDIPGLTETIQVYDNIYLVPIFSEITAANLRTLIPGIPDSQTVVGLDYYVDHQGAEPIHSKAGTLLGFRHPNGVDNFDHHAPVDEMARTISTAPLVAEYIQEHGPIRPHKGIHIINHVDADSVLSSLIIAGKLDAIDQRFSQAAIDADHTGMENDIADLLVAIEPMRNLEFSLLCLNRQLRGESLPEQARDLLQKRRNQREEVRQLVQAGAMQEVAQGVFLIESGKSLRSEFFPATQTEAAIFIIAFPIEGGWEYKLRARNKFPQRAQLNKMGLPYFGGRWNAGGTKRQGAVSISPSDYSRIVAKKFQAIAN